MKDYKTISLFLYELKEFVFKYLNNHLLDTDWTVKPNNFNLFDIRYNGFTFLTQFYFRGDNQNDLPYILLGIVKGYIVEGGIDLEHPASIISTERFTVEIVEEGKMFFINQSTKKTFDNFKDFLNPWLSEISNAKTTHKI